MFFFFFFKMRLLLLVKWNVILGVNCIGYYLCMHQSELSLFDEKTDDF